MEAAGRRGLKIPTRLDTVRVNIGVVRMRMSAYFPTLVGAPRGVWIDSVIEDSGRDGRARRMRGRGSRVQGCNLSIKSRFETAA